MPEEESIPLEIICSYYQVEQSFLESLEEHGLISISLQENRKYILKEEVADLEKYGRMYYELSINVPGIDALQQMLERIKELRSEMDHLRARLKIYE